MFKVVILYEGRSKNTKPTHASLLDISSIGLSDSDNDSDDDVNDKRHNAIHPMNDVNDTSDVSVSLNFTSPRRRGVSLPPESPTSVTPPSTGNLSLPLRRTTSMSRDTSPSSECKVSCRILVLD